MRIDVAVPCVACGGGIPDGAHYCAVCGRGQPTRLPAAHDEVELVDPRVRPPLLPTEPSPRNLFVGVGIVILLLLATVPVLVIRAVFFGPDDAVRDYFGALAARDAGGALVELEPGDLTEATGPLLTDAALAGSGYHPPANFALTSLKVEGVTNALASVTYTIDGVQMNEQLEVHRGRATNLFQRWHIHGGLRTLAVRVPSATGLRVGGATLGPRSGAGQLMAFPGAYVVALPADPLFSAQPVTVVAGSAQGATLTLRIQDSVRAEVERQVTAFIDKCAASTALAPPGCPFTAASSYSSSYYVEPVRWKVVSSPTLQETVGDDGQILVFSQVPGRVQVTGGPGSYSASGTFSFSVEGSATAVNGAVTFSPRQQQ